MPNVRLIARLDVKGPLLIKSIQLEGVRKVGNPQEFALRYYQEGIDEILYMDAVASLYARDTMHQIVRETAENVFVPISVGGGLRTVDDVKEMLRAGADKVAINSAATKRPDLISEVAEKFGSQCMVLQVDAKQTSSGTWEAYRDCGREHTGLDAIEWAIHGAKLGAGEILLTSIDNEGMQDGFCADLVRAISERVTIPVIASGGMGRLDHLNKIIIDGKADAVAMAHVLHYQKLTIPQIREHALASDLSVRPYP